MSAQRTTRHHDQGREEKPTSIREFRWRQQAACRESLPALFFPPGNSHFTRADEEQAKALCSSCPVRAQCLAFAIEHQETHGVWGGLTAEERRALHGTGATVGT